MLEVSVIPAGRPKKSKNLRTISITIEQEELDLADIKRGKLPRGKYFSIAQHNPNLQTTADLQHKLNERDRKIEVVEKELFETKTEKDAELAKINDFRLATLNENIEYFKNILRKEGLKGIYWKNVVTTFMFTGMREAHNWFNPVLTKIIEEVDKEKKEEKQKEMEEKLKEKWLLDNVGRLYAEYKQGLTEIPQEWCELSGLDAEEITQFIENHQHKLNFEEKKIKIERDKEIEEEKRIYKFENWAEVATPEEKNAWWEEHCEKLVRFHAFDLNTTGIVSDDFHNDVCLFALCSGKSEEELISWFKDGAKKRFGSYSREGDKKRVAEIGYDEFIDERKKESLSKNLWRSKSKVYFGDEFPVDLINGKLKYIKTERDI